MRSKAARTNSGPSFQFIKIGSALYVNTKECIYTFNYINIFNVSRYKYVCIDLH